MIRTRIGRVFGTGLVALGLLTAPGWAQKPGAEPARSYASAAIAQPDAERTKSELMDLLQRYPPTLRSVLGQDPSLLENEPYLATYPALAAFLKAHPEISRNPSFYVPNRQFGPPNMDEASRAYQMWNDVTQGLAVFGGFAMAIGLLVWLIRTLVDYRRWSRLAKVQTEVHTKLLDRISANDELLAYVQSPAGSKFLESSPIRLDSSPRSMGAPMGRILWALQGGVVLIAGGVGLRIVSGSSNMSGAQALGALGVIGIALGVGFAISAIISYVISLRLGLIETARQAPRAEGPGA